MVLIEVGEDATQALASIEPSTDDGHVRALSSAAMAVVLGVEREDAVLVGPPFEAMDVDFIKRTYSALVCVFLEAAKGDLSEAEFRSFLRSECGFSDARGDAVARVYVEKKDELRGVLARTGNHSYLPQLEGVDWKLEYCVPSAGQNRGAARELLYRVGLTVADREEGRDGRVEFIANVEELQELVARLKDACKAVERGQDRR